MALRQRAAARLLVVKRARRRPSLGPLALSVLVTAALLAFPGAASAATVRADFNGDAAET